jgi:mono/diheme cytochrome c family protein
MLAVVAAGFHAPQTGAKKAQPVPTSTATAPHVFTITPEEKARKNPIAFTSTAVKRGKQLFESQCSMCHGANGNGRGNLAGAIKVSPPDFTKPGVLSKRTDGELFTIIGQGTSVMPGQRHRLSDQQRWELVDFLRFLEGKTPEPAAPRQKRLLRHQVVVHP